MTCEECKVKVKTCIRVYCPDHGINGQLHRYSKSDEGSEEESGQGHDGADNDDTFQHLADLADMLPTLAATGLDGWHTEPDQAGDNNEKADPFCPRKNGDIPVNHVLFHPGRSIGDGRQVGSHEHRQFGQYIHR